MSVEVVSRRRSRETIEREYPGAFIVDVTSRGDSPWVKFSPFYPHGAIPVPFSPSVTAESVEGVWQGLKVFEEHGIDEAKFHVTGMKGIKRTCRKYGRVLGHQKGVSSSELLQYVAARYEIYLPCYRFVLDNFLAVEVKTLLDEARSGRKLVLLDYETNCDITNPSRPLSHASLVRSYLSNDWPVATR